MQEFSIRLDGHLFGGLSPDDRMPTNAPFMEHIQNMKASPMGLVLPETIRQPVAALDFPVEWPFPSLHGHKGPMLVGRKDRLYRVSPDGTYTPELLHVQEMGEPGSSTPAPITPGGSWHHADFHGNWGMCNGIDCIVQTGYAPNPWKLPCSVASVANWNDGRWVLGGFDETNFRPDGVRFLLDSFHSGVPFHLQNLIQMMSGVGKNFVFWSSVGGDLLPLFDGRTAIYGHPFEVNTGYDPQSPYLLDIEEQNLMGMAAMPYSGAVLRCMPLGSDMVCYGENGIAVMRSYQDGRVGFPELIGHGAGVGLAGRSAVGGDHNGHILVDREGNIWNLYIGERGVLFCVRLGFRHLMAPLLESGNELVVSHDPTWGDFWISAGQHAYILTRSGQGFVMGGPIIRQVPTSLVRRSDGLCGYFKDGGEEIVVRSWPIDMDERARKRVTTCQVNMEGIWRPAGAMHYRYAGHEPYRRAFWKPLSPEGNFFPYLSAVDFKVELRGTPAQSGTPRISAADIRFQSEDRRFRRGTKAPGASFTDE